MPSIHLVTYRCTDAPFTVVLKHFRTSAKKSGHGENFRNFRTTPSHVLRQHVTTDSHPIYSRQPNQMAIMTLHHSILGTAFMLHNTFAKSVRLKITQY